MGFKHFMPAACAALLVVASAVTPVVVEARDFDRHSYKGSYDSRDVRHHRHHRDHHYKPHFNHSWKYRNHRHHGRKPHLNRHERWQYHDFQPRRHRDYQRYGHHGAGAGAVTFSLRYRR